MNTYLCWVVERPKMETLEIIKAASSFAARQIMARKYAVLTIDVVACRQFEASEG